MSEILMKIDGKRAMNQKSQNIYILDTEDPLSKNSRQTIPKMEGFRITDDEEYDEDESTTDVIDTEDISKFLLPRRIKLEAPDLADGEVSNDMVTPEELILSTGGSISTNFLLSDDNSLTLLQGDLDESGVLIEHMDIRSPLSKLRSLLEQRLKMQLGEYKFWLQDAQMLEPHKNLVDQCVQGEGLVQINVEVKHQEQKINIVDVLKPTNDYLELHEGMASNAVEDAPKNNLVRWVIDSNFNKELERLKIPQDPWLWDQQQVKKWLMWAVRQFNLVGIKLADWNIDGPELYNMELATFQKKVPKDPGDLFWTHLELLRKCKFVAVMYQNPKNKDKTNKELKELKLSGKVGSRGQLVSTESGEIFLEDGPAGGSSTSSGSGIKRTGKGKDGKKVSRVLGSNSISLSDAKGGLGNRTGNNGQIQLWQFLLDLLTSKNHRDVIEWITDDGEFKLNNPEMVAQLWGQRKNKPAMTYEKLSRALRYYYDGDMICKVHGKRFVYKFVCDLKQLLGFSASELNMRVTQCAMKNGMSSTYCDYYEHILK